MRKDVRFGLTIGGSLLAVLVLWVALFDRQGSDKVSDVALAPATQPTDVAQGPVETSSPTGGSEIAASGAATQPANSEEASTAGHDWNMLLETGGPATQPAMLSASVPVDSSMLAPAGATTRPAVAMAGMQSSGATQTGGSAAGGTHKVLAGESFFTIAKAAYGDGAYYTRLEDANPNVNPNKLRVGTVIVVPDLKEPLSARSASAGIQASATTGATVDSSKSYRVKASDTLMAIARKLYGDGQEWQKIYDANRDVIGGNPARLKVGMVLRLPQAPTVALAN